MDKNKSINLATRPERGFTLTELVVVIAIIGTLAGLVAGAVGGLGTSGQLARLGGDADTIAKAADRFFVESFPQTYPVVALDNTDPSIVPQDDLGVRLVNFEAPLPQDVATTFTPDFLKEIPDSAALVSWRIDTRSGSAFFARDGALLARASSARLDVSAQSKTPSAISSYTFKLQMKRGDAATDTINITIPALYVIGGRDLPAGTKLGEVIITFGETNPWATGETITIQGDVKTTSITNEWAIEVDYDTNISTGAFNNINVKNTLGADIRTHKLSVVQPNHETPGRFTLRMDRTNEAGGLVVYSDPDANEAGESWQLTIFGSVLGETVIKNPSVANVYRWLATEQTAIDIKDFLDTMPGNQAVVIK